MKKLVFAVIAISMLAMVTPNPGSAEPTHPNEIGLYATPDGYGETGTYDVGIPVDVYLVLTIPVANGGPCSLVRAFDCQLNFNPIGGIFKLGDALGGEGFNIGDADNISAGYLEYIVGFGAGVPVADETAVLVHFVFLNTNAVPVEVTLGPASIPSIPNHMSFFSGTPPLEVMYSMGGSHEAPVFMFNGMAVAVEQESFGSVKALYR